MKNSNSSCQLWQRASMPSTRRKYKVVKGPTVHYLVTKAWSLMRRCKTTMLMKMRAERGLVHVLIEARAIDDDGEGNSLTPVVSSSHCPLPPPLKLHIKRKSAALEPPTLTP